MLNALLLKEMLKLPMMGKAAALMQQDLEDTMRAEVQDPGRVRSARPVRSHRLHRSIHGLLAGVLGLLLGHAGLVQGSEVLFGTNFPGTVSVFTVSLPSGTTNVAVVVTNTPIAWSHLFLDRLDVSQQTVATFRSAQDRASNQIHLEIPEFQPGTYQIRVFTPLESATHAFFVTIMTNVPDLRSDARPAVKPMGFTTTGTLTLASGARWHYFQVDVPSSTNSWRIVLSRLSGSETPNLYLARNSLPTPRNHWKARTNAVVHSLVLSEADLTPGTYFIGVELSDRASSDSTYQLATEVPGIRDLPWDPGVSHEGTLIQTNTDTTGGHHFFRVICRATQVGGWRTALTVESGEAHVYLRQGAFSDNPNDYPVRSERAGDDGWVLPSTAFAPGQTWYICVFSSPGARWRLVSGEPYVMDLGTLAPPDSSASGARVSMGPEGMRFFRTTVPPETLAWRLWLHGATNELLVRRQTIPLPASPGLYDLRRQGSMLVVPTYLVGGTSYYLGVPGRPGEVINLDSRQHQVTDLPFLGQTSVTVQGFPYVTYRIHVPPDLTAWSTDIIPSTGDANLCLRRELVPNEWNNDAFSEAGGGVTDSISLVPPPPGSPTGTPGLSDGVFFVTIYGASNFTATFRSGVPVVTDVPFRVTLTNDEPNRTGWRYYRVLDINSQLGILGWELLLSNAPPEALLALRRNAVPGRWSYRRNNNTNVLFAGHVDASTSYNRLQRPDHLADIWYIGVYSPSSPLGSYTLTLQELVAADFSLDGASTNVVDHPPGQFYFWRVDIPSGILGWDLRVRDVLRGDPRLVVRREALPTALTTTPWSQPGRATNWPSRYQWAPTTDWTDLDKSPEGTAESGRILACGLGNPLEAGTYYVGVYNPSPTQAMEYTLVSRFIGPGCSIPVRPLEFDGGFGLISNLPPREVAYFSVHVPSNTPSWDLRLTPQDGDALLLIQQGALPNITGRAGPATALRGGRRLQKPGQEEYVLLPSNGATTIPTGMYYLAVVSEGQNPDPLQRRIGTNHVRAALESMGALQPEELGALAAQELSVSRSIPGGDVHLWHFSVTPDTEAFEVWLEDRTGNPRMTLRADHLVPAPADDYGADGGATATWQSDQVLSVVGPPSTNFTLTIQAAADSGAYPDASYNLRLRPVTSLPLAFDGGTARIEGQVPGTWRFFKVIVPSNALGWDLRIAEVTNGDPRLVVRRALLPDSLRNVPWSAPHQSTAWPVGAQWVADTDWTGFSQDADGRSRRGHILQMGMGNPLEPGVYYVGVINGSGSGVGSQPMHYTLISRGIGEGFSIPVVPLSPSNGVHLISNLPPREAAYFSVSVPNHAASWRVRLSTNAGDMLLAVQSQTLPNVGAAPNNSVLESRGGKVLHKVGDEHYVLLPPLSRSNVPAQTYYLMAVSLGHNPAALGGSRIGTNASTASLLSVVNEQPTELGLLDPGAEIESPETLPGGSLRLYQFRVPEGMFSLDIRLDDRAANPRMTLRYGSLPPSSPSAYGSDGGQPVEWSHDSYISVPNPVPGVYTLLVHADRTGTRSAGPVYDDATYKLRIRGIGAQAVPFDGGSITVTNHVPNTWRYFVVSNVPPDALGWEIRLTNVQSGDPRLVLRRGAAPGSLATEGWTSPHTATNWPDGAQWAAGQDWTQYRRYADGSNRLGHVLQVGMGNPLEPGGPYFIGVFNGSSTGAGAEIMSYTLTTRGIGSTYQVPVFPLAFAGGSITNGALPAGDAAYYRVEIPSNTPSWKLRLANGTGESMLLVQQNYLPNVGGGTTPATRTGGGYRVQKVGHEHYVLLPEPGQTTIPAGVYYVLVASEGEFPSGSGGTGRLGTNVCSYLLQSVGPLVPEDLGEIGLDGVLHTVSQLEAGDLRAYRFSLSQNFPGLEVRLDNRLGNPYLTLRTGASLPQPYNAYGRNGGHAVEWSGDQLVRLVRPAATNYTLVVQAAPQGSSWADAAYTLRVVPTAIPDLAFDPQMEGCDTNVSLCTNSTVCGLLADNERAYYRVRVPEVLPDGSPVLGWRLTVLNRSGNAQLRVRPSNLPSDSNSADQTRFATNEAVIVPPYLGPGTWYVEIKGSGPTEYCLTSQAVRLLRPPWTMPGPDEEILTPGLLGGPYFADTGIMTNGMPVPDPDGAIELERGKTHFYAVDVPPDNEGLLRVVLEAVTGNPDVYLRPGYLPTVTHNLPLPGNSSPAYQRRLTGFSSEYANFTVDNSRYTNALESGVWYIAVRAEGPANARYRLRLSKGNVTNLNLNDSVQNETLPAGDWKYYRFILPTDAPLEWLLSFQQHVGDVIVYLRDTVPPGQFASTNDLRDWSKDNKNHAGVLYRSFDAPGTYTNRIPPLRPGHVYYVGVRALTDAIFSLSSVAATETLGELPSISFYQGSISLLLEPGQSAVYVIDVPPEATRWISTASHPASVWWYLEQGSLPTGTAADHLWSRAGANVGINQKLNQPGGWPWLSGYRYYLAITNTSSEPQSFAWHMDGRNCDTDDSDNDGLPDCWELRYWPSLSTQRGSTDFDGDGNNNMVEFQDGTDPTNPQSMLARLFIEHSPGGAVEVIPALEAYPWGTPVMLRALPELGFSFLAWTGPDARGWDNPLQLLMTTNRVLRAWFGPVTTAGCGLLQADYRFEGTLGSTAGAAPELAFIHSGHEFVQDVVLGRARTVLRFPQGTGLVLSNASRLIPTNSYTIALLFRLDTVSGWRRILDTKHGSPDHGLYVVNGRLAFRPSSAQSPSTCLTNGTWHQVLITRDLDGLLTVYADGTRQFQFQDSSGYGLITAADTLRFFKDNTTEESGGAVARVRLFTCALTEAQAVALDLLPDEQPLLISSPEVTREGRFRFRILGAARGLVRVQSSRDLIHWTDVAEYQGFTGELWHTHPSPLTNHMFFRAYQR